MRKATLELGAPLTRALKWPTSRADTQSQLEQVMGVKQAGV
jgi:hypothetical protein